jgi:hypothetical protein
MTSAPDDPLAAIIIQVAQHSEQIGGIDARETGHHQHLTAWLEDLTNRVTSAKTRLDAIGATITRHEVIIDQLHGLDTEVAALNAQLASRSGRGIGDQDSGYQPVPAPCWWKLTGPDRDTATDRLRAWVDQIYGPGYGHLAAALPPCWDRHALCLYTLDWLSELWSTLYLNPERSPRTLAAQAEWQTRLLPAAAEQMAREATRCTHMTTNGQRPSKPTRQ